MEILAPAGSMASLIGAINAGANAVYLAGKRFGARAYAANFEDEEILKVIHYAHMRSVFVYVAINTIVFDDEIDDLLAYTDFLVSHGVDALIIQDLGVLHLLSKRYPDTDLHASTQMNTHHVDQVRFLKDLGVKRIVLARETPLDMIKKIKKEVDIEIEVFVHGALCVSYSGQCLMSSMNGGRSGNRGECAQPCRLPYQLIKDKKVISDTSYLLSTKDLMTVEHLSELMEIGIDSIKIEGRMRKPEYVIQAVLSYKHAMDHYLNQTKINFETEIKDLMRVFNRDFTKGYMFGETPKDINHDLRPNHMGTPVGKVIDVKSSKATILLSDKLIVNDGYRIIGEKDYGDRVSRIVMNQKLVDHANAGDVVTLDVKEDVYVGSLVLKTLDYQLEEDLDVYLDENYKKIPIDGEILAYSNQKLILSIRDEKNHIEVTSDDLLELAQTSPSSRMMILEQFSKLGQTSFYFKNIEVKTDEKAFVPVRLMNQLRREAILQLENARIKRDEKTISTNNHFDSILLDQDNLTIVKVTNQDQYNYFIDDENIHLYYEDKINISNQPKKNQTVMLKRVQSKNSKPVTSAVCCHEVGTLYKNQNQFPIFTSEFFNVSNIYAAHLLYLHGAKRITLSLELSRDRILQFSSKYEEKFHSKPNLEMVIYGRPELMISKYCPIAKTFKTQQNCLLCEKNQYEIKDRMNISYPLIHDGQCNIRIIHQKPLNLFAYLKELKQAGISAFRLDFTIENHQQISEVMSRFESALNGNYRTNYQQNENLGRYLK